VQEIAQLAHLVPSVPASSGTLADVLMAATPAWFADNVAQIAGALLVTFTFLVVRLVQKTALRFTLLCLLAALAVFVYANRAPLKTCARTCACSMAGQDITVPGCDPEL